MPNPDRQSHASQGQNLGRYRLRGVLGQGGMGRLFVAEQKGIEGFTKIVALKQILPHLADSPEFRRMFLTEARVAARLEHPNIVVTYELGEVDGIYFMAMEYLPGEDLGAVLARCRNAPMPVEIAAATAHQALIGLQYAHELQDPRGRLAGLVHRDVNPSNIFVTYHGMVKLLDFGVVKGASTSSTSPGTFKGKYGYCAPEQLEGDAIDGRTDVFCVGIVLWECLTGQRLFKGNSDAAVIDAVRAQQIVPPSTLRPDLPAELDELTMRALSRDRQRRFQSAHEMAEALDRFLHHRSQRPTPKTIGQWLEGLFGAQRALLKKSIAQGNDIEGAIEQLRAMGTSAPAPSQALAASASRPSGTVKPRTLWSTNVKKSNPEVGPRPGSSPSHPPPATTFVGFGSDEDRPIEEATSRFTVPQELAEAAGMPSDSQVAVAAPRSGSQPSMAPMPVTGATAGPASGGRALKIIAAIGALGAAAVLALSLVDGDKAVPVTAPGGPSSGSVALNSDPPGANVLVDGEPTGLTTPTVLSNLRRGGVLEVRLDKPGFQAVTQKIEVPAEGQGIHSFKMRAEGGFLRLEGLPQGASVFVDDVLTEVRGPLAVRLGPRKVRVEAGGEVIFEKTIEARGEEQTVTVRRGGKLK